MIDPKAEPLFNRSPYKRVDLASKRRLPVTITIAEANSADIDPDLALYTFIYGFGWILKDIRDQEPREI